MMPISVLSRMIDSNGKRMNTSNKYLDMITSLISLLLTSPWKRKSSGKLFIFSGSTWDSVSPSDMLRLDKVSAQVWLALYNLLMDNECRKKYKFNSANKATIMKVFVIQMRLILKLKTLLNENLIDQLPLLDSLQKFLDQLALFDPPSVSSTFLIEQVPELQEQLQKQDWTKLSTLYVERFSIDVKKYTQVWKEPALESLVGKPKCPMCGEPATKRCSRCKNEWY